MKRSRHQYWGKWKGQTVGLRQRRFYIKGYDRKGQPTEIEATLSEMDDLLHKTLGVKGRL